MRFDGLVTPCYIINDEEYAQNITRFRAEFESRWNGRVLFGYSVKTNNFPYMLKAALKRSNVSARRSVTASIKAPSACA